jgi:tetratricopeptide (TPR) repeat protein
MLRSLASLLLCLSLAPASRAQTILVLPFFNDSASANVDWIGESLARTVSEALTSHGLLVLEREDREEVYHRLSIRPQAHLTHASVIKVAEALDATDVIFGEFEVTGAPGSKRSIRMTACTLDITHLRKGPQFLESGALDDLAQLQSHLAWQVLRFTAPARAPSLEEFQRERPRIRLDAIENYTRGLLAATPELKHRFFTQAARLDDRFSQPQFELGRLYWAKKDYRLAVEWLVKVKPATPRYLEASFLLGLCRYYTDDFAGAQEALDRVANALPLNEVYNDLGAAESRLGRPGALENFRKALEGDDSDPDYHFNVGYALWKRGEFVAAAASFSAVLERSPEDADAATMLDRCLNKVSPRSAEFKGEALERLKLNYEEGAYRQLKAALQPKK